MKVRVYFCKESDIEIIIKGNKIGRQALDTIYDLVWRKSLFISLNRKIWASSMETITNMVSNF